MSDNNQRRTYAQLMADAPAHIALKIDFEEPIELGHFVSAFTSLANQYEKFIREEYPRYAPEANIYVKEVRHSSIEADLIPWLYGALASVPILVSHMDQIIIVDTFLRRYGGRLTSYFNIGGRAADASKSDLKDFMGAVAAIANDPNGAAKLEAVYFKDGKREIGASIKFNTAEAKRATAEIENHHRELEKKEAADHQRVLMRFKRSDTGDVEIGKRSGERVIIETLSPKDLPLIYASNLAEQRIKHEIREAIDNVFKKGFIVDVNVETQQGKPIAYRVTELHQIIDLD